MTNANQPSDEAILQTLGQLATSLRMDDSHRNLFLNRFIEVVLLGMAGRHF
jgi:hypothetical protein